MNRTTSVYTVTAPRQQLDALVAAVLSHGAQLSESFTSGTECVVRFRARGDEHARLVAPTEPMHTGVGVGRREVAP